MTADKSNHNDYYRVLKAIARVDAAAEILRGLPGALYQQPEEQKAKTIIKQMERLRQMLVERMQQIEAEVRPRGDA